jgi:hypothetical protein
MARRKFDINSLPSNDQNPTNKDIEVVATPSRVKTRKSGGLANEVRNIGNSLFSSIILPAMKGAVLDFFNDGLRMALFREDSPRGVGRPTAYNQRYKTRRQKPWQQSRAPQQNVQQIEEVFEDIYFDERREAERVLGRMMEFILEYGQATVGDLYNMCGLSPNYIHEDWEWHDLNRCRVQYSTNGYVIDFPDPVYRR